MLKQKIFLLSMMVMILGNSSVILESSAGTATATALAASTTKTSSCVARTTMMTRGQAWVTKKVPYSQTKTHEGYRTDCSGFVSMCWGLNKPGHTTSTMHKVSKSITKNQLKQGDAINCPGRHILLFAGWTDSKKTHYYALEEANSKIGTVKRTTPYPYYKNDSCFKPIRYVNAC